MRRWAARGSALLLRGSALLLLAIGAPPPRIADLQNISVWRAAPSEGVRLEVSSRPGPSGSSLRLDFDFQGRAGWAAVHRPLSIELPENYEFSFAVRGEARANDLEIKLIDPSGENVWWSVRRDFEPPREWLRIHLKKRHFSFAWGPAGGGEMRQLAALEIAVTARAGGQGWIEFSDFEWNALAPAASPQRAPLLTASSNEPGSTPQMAMDGDPTTAWRAAVPGPAWLAIDFGARREYGGLTVRWEPGRSARRYFVETSEDGETWILLREVRTGSGRRDHLYLPDSESRYVRLFVDDPGAPPVGLAEIAVEPLSFSETPNAFFEQIARDEPRGAYPRGFVGEQSYWTVVGISGDSECALMSEDGSVEPKKGSFSVEPLLFFDGSLTTWSDVAIDHSQEDGDLPIPSVTWRQGSLTLAVTALAQGEPGRSAIYVRYRIRNDDARRRRGKLFLAVRPIQVNPPTQFLNGPGGVSPIRRIEWTGSAVRVNNENAVLPLVRPSGFGAAPFDEGPIVDFLLAGGVSAAARVEDPFGYASGFLAFDFDLASHGSDEVSLRLPLHADFREESFLSRSNARTVFARRLSETTRLWRAELGRVQVDLPQKLPLARIFRTNLADILIERDGPAIRPGTRAYARSWIRDAALIGDALLRLGHPEAVRAYLDWFAPYQSADGRVPCCVDRRGADPVIENDSHGEFVFLVAQYWRFTHDTDGLQRLFPHVERAVAFLETLRQKERSPAYREPGKLAFFGLLPESISHEGYSSKPVHSYWDDFWALRGLRDAAELAASLNRRDLVEKWTSIADEFEKDLLASLRRTISAQGIDYIPGSVELADFDPTATTIALDPLGAIDRLPSRELTATFERYYTEAIARRDGRTPWDAYTPYEIRSVGAFVRLGWRDRAQEMLRFFLTGLRPSAWNVWAEVVGREERAPRFLGDIPHAWVGADFIRSLLDCFAYQRPSDRALVLAAGIPDDWLRDGRPVGIRELRTPLGLLTYSLRKERNALRVSIGGGISVPPGGIALRPPLPHPPRRVSVDGKNVAFDNGEVLVRRVPSTAVFEIDTPHRTRAALNPREPLRLTE